MKIEFIADKLQVSGPRATDNSFVVKLETGENPIIHKTVENIQELDYLKVITCNEVRG